MQQIFGSNLAQGDLLKDCIVPSISMSSDPTEKLKSKAVIRNVIVLTQSCDLENKKARFVAVCPIFTVEQLKVVSSEFGKPEKLNEIRKGRVESLHVLASTENAKDPWKSWIVDFREIYSLPVEYITAHAESLGNRFRLNSPYLEHFSQAFARFFMRVGLPSGIPEFKKT